MSNCLGVLMLVSNMHMLCEWDLPLMRSKPPKGSGTLPPGIVGQAVACKTVRVIAEQGLLYGMY